MGLMGVRTCVRGKVEGKMEWQALGRWLGWAEHWQDGMGFMNSEGLVWTVCVLDLYGSCWQACAPGL
jgi:hypothetical protein